MRVQQKAQQQGFTLIELMIVVAIVAILAGVGMPAYQNYAKKAEFSELIGAAAAYKTGVEICLNMTDTPNDCDAGSNSIPSGYDAGASKATASIATIAVANGTITVTAGSTHSLAGADYELSASSANGLISWTAECTPAAYCS